VRELLVESFPFPVNDRTVVLLVGPVDSYEQGGLVVSADEAIHPISIESD
jgi:hypothetical protein